MMQRLISKQKIPRYICVITHMKDYSYSTKHEINPNVVEMPELRLSVPKDKMKKRAPFIKNFFRGVYDVEFAAFPEPQTYDRHKEFFEWLKPIADFIESSVDGETIDKTGEIPSEIIEQLKYLGVFRAAVPEQYNGLGLNYSEYGKLLETLSRIPVLGVYFSKQAIPISFISAHASETQKTAYLPQISSGKCLPTLCISEDVDGSEGSAILTKATRSACGNFWALDGIKTYVVNGENSNLFVVLAECIEAGQSDDSGDTISAFLVERSFGGITIGPPIKTIGYRGLSLCDIKFENTMVPKENLIGTVGSASESFTSIYSNGKQNIGAQAIGITKRYLQLMVRHLKNDKDFNAVKLQNDAIQECIARISCSIYGMESVLYLTTGILDTVANQDCELEQCIVEAFCVDACIQSLIMGSNILGLSSHIEGNAFERLMRDALCLLSIDGTKTNLQSTIALMGIQYFGNDISSNVRAMRNPWSDPMLIFRKIFSTQKFRRLYIDDNLHPTLKTTADFVECGINKLRHTVEEVIVRHGRLVCERQIDLKRISEAASFLYVMAAAIARASRSYCLGMRDSEKELKIAQVMSYLLHQKIERLVRELDDGHFVNGDLMFIEIADRVFEKDAYFVEHPLARNS